MDTRFWGPSGWRLLHMISFSYTPEKDKAAMRQFFEILPFVLPCKYCRSNLVKHYKALPLEPALNDRDSFTKWLYKIHGLVNETLRDQGQKIPEDPPFSKVAEMYKERLAFGCSKTDFPGWEFLFSIVESHPLAYEETPLPLAPPKQTLKTKKEMLEWNYLSGQCRFNYVCRFWKLLPHVLPFDEWRQIWKEEMKNCCNSMWKTRQSSRKALWEIRKTIEEKLVLLNKTTYHDLCKTLEYYKSGCAYKQNKNTKTCRRLRTTTRKRKID
jgi:hypothetical protein